jgi:hypothetical protein
VALEQRHARPARGKIDGRGQSADPGADDDDMLLAVAAARHRATPPSWPIAMPGLAIWIN